MLFALDEGDWVVACGNEAVGVFEGGANADSVNGEVAVDEFATNFISLDFDIHKGVDLTFNI